MKKQKLQNLKASIWQCE